jgi:hypothetical protein
MVEPAGLFCFRVTEHYYQVNGSGATGPFGGDVPFRSMEDGVIIYMSYQVLVKLVVGEGAAEAVAAPTVTPKTSAIPAIAVTTMPAKRFVITHAPSRRYLRAYR